MSFILCKASRHGRFSISASPPPLPMLLFLRQLTSNEAAKEHSFTVSYLVKNCGLSSQSALSASKHVHFENPRKPNSALAFFENHGFSKAQISNVVKGYPRVLLCNPEKTLSPKLEYLYCKGISVPDVAKSLSANPVILKCSLGKQIIPSFTFFLDLFKSDEKVIATLKRYAGILAYDAEAYAAPNVNLLRENGVPESNIVSFVHKHPKAIIVDAVKFKAAIEDVKRMGFNPLQTKFVAAVRAIVRMSKSTWASKVEVYKRCGWSEEDILAAFWRFPNCMVLSLDKITATMDFFVNKMGLEPSLIAKYPHLLSLSLEKRIVPRSSIAQVLVSKGLLKKIPFALFFYTREKVFLEKYVNCNEKEAPQLLKLYKTTLGLPG